MLQKSILRKVGPVRALKTVEQGPVIGIFGV